MKLVRLTRFRGKIRRCVVCGLESASRSDLCIPIEVKS